MHIIDGFCKRDSSSMFFRRNLRGSPVQRCILHEYTAMSAPLPLSSISISLDRLGLHAIVSACESCPSTSLGFLLLLLLLSILYNVCQTRFFFLSRITLNCWSTTLLYIILNEGTRNVFHSRVANLQSLLPTHHHLHNTHIHTHTHTCSRDSFYSTLSIYTVEPR